MSFFRRFMFIYISLGIKIVLLNVSFLEISIFGIDDFSISVLDFLVM